MTPARSREFSQKLESRTFRAVPRIHCNLTLTHSETLVTSYTVATACSAMERQRCAVQKVVPLLSWDTACHVLLRLLLAVLGNLEGPNSILISQANDGAQSHDQASLMPSCYLRSTSGTWIRQLLAVVTRL